MIAPLGIDAVSLSDSNLGSEVLEGIEMPLRDFRKKDPVTPTIETERGHKYPRHE